ncbi:MAG: hypothetical protein J6B24_02870 [Clostridia bacterium]|nr:hypothetical protein [Clostridia bacterium]
MSKKKRPTEEGKDTPKNCVEIPLPELVDDSFEKGRVFQYGTARWAYGFLLFIIVACVVTAVTEIPDGLFLVWGLLLLPTVALLLISKYEIRHDREGFSVCIGKRVLRQHSWSEVTAVDSQKRVFVNGKKLFAEPSMSGYEAFYDRAHAASKRKSQPKPAAKAPQNTPKPTEGKDESPKSKGYIEIDLSGLTDKLYDGYERALIGRKFDGENSLGGDPKKQGRLALPRFYAIVGYVGILVTLFIVVGITVAQGGIEIPLFLGFSVFIALGAALVLIGKYEVHYDENGFYTRLGKKLLRQYAWSEVTGVANYTTVYVNGKKLFVDHDLDGFGFFYEKARMACKGRKSKTAPSEKKQKNSNKTGK